MPPTRNPNTDGPRTSQRRRRQPRREIPKRSEQLSSGKKLELRINSKAWIIPDLVGNLKYKCTACKVSMNAKQSVASHLKHERHRSNVLSIMAQKAELNISLFFVEYNIPFHMAEHLGSFLRDCFVDSWICKEITVNSDKVRSTIIKKVGPNIKSRLANKLRTRKFSILADKLTDISSAKTFCIMVRYFDDDNGQIKISFWKLSSTENRNVVNQRAVAEYLYEDIRESFNEFNIPNENIVGFGSDGCNVIMSGEDSVASRFKKDCPGIIVVKFINHSIHLCASKAVESLPFGCEESARVVHSSLKCKVNKSSHLVQLQELFDLEPHGMLHPSQARWLSVTAVVDCILKHWPALIRFYGGMSEPEKLLHENEVLKWLDDPFIKLYYEFLQSVLPKFDDLNAIFKSSHENITEVNAKFENCYRDILGCFLKRNYARHTKLQDIDPAVRENHMCDKDMLLGENVRTVTNRITGTSSNISGELKAFYSNCRLFYETVAVEIYKRCNFGDPTIALIAVLHPDVSQCSSESRPSPILSLAAALPLISSGDRDWQQEIEARWHELPFMNFPEDIAKESEPDVFWGKILNWKNGAGENEFSILARFALDALISPHTNADYERIFSKINLMRSRTSNELESDCEAIYHAVVSSDDTKRNGNGRVSFLPSNKTTNSVTSNPLNGKPDAIASTSRN